MYNVVWMWWWTSHGSLLKTTKDSWTRCLNKESKWSELKLSRTALEMNAWNQVKQSLTVCGLGPETWRWLVTNSTLHGPHIAHRIHRTAITHQNLWWEIGTCCLRSWPGDIDSQSCRKSHQASVTPQTTLDYLLTAMIDAYYRRKTYFFVNAFCKRKGWLVTINKKVAPLSAVTDGRLFITKSNNHHKTTQRQRTDK